MAQTKKKNTSYSGGSQKKTKNTQPAGQKRGTRSVKRSAAGKTAGRTEAEIRLHDEIMVLLLLAASILLFLGNMGLGGIAGNWVRTILFGLFGIPAYIFPFVLFFLGAFLIANDAGSLSARKTGGFLGIYLFSCAFFQIISSGFEKGRGLTDYFRTSAYDHSGGGIIGGAIVAFLGSLFGYAGAVVIIIIALIISAIIMTQKPLISSIKESSTEKFMEARDSRYERMQQKLERKEQRRLDREAYLEKRDQEIRNRAEEKRRKEEAETARRNRRRDLAQDGNDGPQIVTLKADSAGEQSGSDLGTDRSHLKRKTSVQNQMAAPEEPAAAVTIPSAEQSYKPDPIPDCVISGPVAVRNQKPVSAEELMEEEAESGSEEKAAVPRKVRSVGGADEEVQEELKKEAEKEEELPYVIPSLGLLNKSEGPRQADTADHLKSVASKLQETLHNFGIDVTISHISCGPTVTRYEMVPQSGVRVSRILSLTDDIKLALAAADVRIEAPIPGKSAIGIEVPNKTNVAVLLSEMLGSDAYRSFRGKIAFAVGKDIAGLPVVTDLSKMPHVLIAGATGSGKSVCINTLIMSILYKYGPDQVRLIMIDPKMVELSVYNGIPHLFVPVVTDPKKAAGALNWGVSEMTERYRKFAEAGVRDMEGYNQKVDAAREQYARFLKEKEAEAKEASEKGEALIEDDTEETFSLAKMKKMPRIVIIVDELADLMMVAQHEVEDAIVRLSQLARAAGIHLVIATQRPSVNVITGLIKANMPSRIALAVSSGVDSRTILDMNGAERLLGKGDMLFAPQNLPKPVRIQGAFVSDDEIARVVKFLKKKAGDHQYDEEIQKQINSSSSKAAASIDGSSDEEGDTDAYFADAGKLIIQKDKASIGMLQRAFRIGFNRAARIMDQLADAGVVGAEEGTKPRKVLMTLDQFENYLEEN
ncbi:MAG: DNA translocase FtsK [Eubacterium sp.]|nr:DNA translocase FtsK [Eubacterium sp.]